MMNPNPSLKSIPSKVSNTQVEQLIAMREAREGLKARLKLMDEAVGKAETDLINLVESGADVSACGRELSIQRSERRYPAWKEHFISRLGKVEADAVLNATEPTLHRKLIVK